MWGALEGCAAAVSGWRLLCVSIAFTSERKFRSLSSMVLMTIWRNQKGDKGIFKGENGNFVVVYTGKNDGGRADVEAGRLSSDLFPFLR